MQNLGCRLLLAATFRLFVPLAVGTILGALLWHTSGGIVGATVGILLGLVWSTRSLLTQSASPTAKPTPPPA